MISFRTEIQKEQKSKSQQNQNQNQIPKKTKTSKIQKDRKIQDPD
jgi:hypothetical protein